MTPIGPSCVRGRAGLSARFRHTGRRDGREAASVGVPGFPRPLTRSRRPWHRYDAQIRATAALDAIPAVLSEGFPDGLQLGPVRFVDPFAEGLEMSALDG